jgi:recombination protein RecA
MEGTKLDIKGIYEKTKVKAGLSDPKPVTWVLPTGSMLLDRITGVGGYPGGRIIEIFGPESGGKTTMAMHACVEAQRMGVPFAYIDVEQSLDPVYFKNMGLLGEPNVDWLHIVPDTGEAAFTALEQLLCQGVRFIVVDSVAAMIPKAELVGDYGEAQMGAQARLMSQGMRKITGIIGQTESIVIFINQIRMKIGIVYGNPETTTGGNALKFYASIRVSVRNGKSEDILQDKDGNYIGKLAVCKTVKNKVAPPMRECSIPIVWGKGIDRDSELLDVAILEGVVVKSSSYFSYKDVKLNGRVNFLKAMPEIKDEICEDLKRKWAR